MIIIISALGVYFFKYRQEEKRKTILLHELNRVLDNPFSSWLVIYLILELGGVALQGTEWKQYPYFPVFPPLALLSAISVYYLSVNMKLSKRWVSVGLCLFFLLKLGVCAIESRKECVLVAKWTDAQLIGEIKRHIKNNRDLFTLDGPPYLYLETNTIPPIPRNAYGEWQWDFFGTKPELSKSIIRQLEDAAPSVVTRFVQSNVPDAVFSSFLSKYREVGRYLISYDPRPGQGIILYVRK
jgi:hypothetical protein